MPSPPSAALAGSFRLGGKVEVNRLGFGAVRITGAGIWGPPADRDEVMRTLRRLPDLDVNLIDTADSYGPFVSEDLIAEALWPYDGLLVATKGGMTRQGPNAWRPIGRPEYLRQCVLMSLRRLKVEQIGLWQLHRIDNKTPRDDQFGVIADMLKEGLIAQAGLSQVSVEEIQAAQKLFPVATVQNRYNLADRADEAVLEYCAAEGIGFVPWYPLAAGALARPGGAAERIAAARGLGAGQIALAWLLQRSPVLLPIPGTSRQAHLEENVAATAVRLSAGEIEALTAGDAPDGLLRGEEAGRL